MTLGSSFTIHIRLTSAASFTITSSDISPATTTVLQLKQRISAEDASGHVPVERQRLIYKGRILSDDTRTLSDYGIVEDNQTVHLVKGSAPVTGAAAPSPAPTTIPTATNRNAVPMTSSASTASSPFSPTPSNNNMNFMQQMLQMQQSMGLGGAGMNANAGSGALPNLNQMQQQLMNNPEFMNSMMNNPMIQSLMNNPEFIRSTMETNPQMRQVLDANPELRNVLQDPDFMRRSMEMMRNPNAMMNMMRNNDLAMSQIENMPGGFNALRRMYEDVQEPFMNALSHSSPTATNPGSSSNTATSATTGASGTAMPNPWGGGSTATTAANNPTPTTTPIASSILNPWATPASNTNTMNPFSMATTGGQPLQPGMMPNMEQTLSMLENPMVGQMMNQLMADPAMMQLMMESNPMLRQLRETNPEAAALMSNPDYMRAMMNPENLRAMMQLQSSLAPFQRNMPSGFPSIMPGQQPQTQPGMLDFTTLLNPNLTAAANTSSSSNMNPWAMPSLLAPPVLNQPTIPPEQRYRAQLQSLNDMGFDDNESNIRVLVQTHGNVNRAIDILLSGNTTSSSSGTSSSSNSQA